MRVRIRIQDLIADQDPGPFCENKFGGNFLSNFFSLVLMGYCYLEGLKNIDSNAMVTIDILRHSNPQNPYPNFQKMPEADPDLHKINVDLALFSQR